MMNSLPTFLLVVSLMWGSSRPQCLTADDSEAGVESSNDRQGLYAGQQIFSVSMLRELSLSNPTQNIFFSPYSTYHALMLAYFGASNYTEANLKAVLRIPERQNKRATMQAYRLEKYLRAVNMSSSYELRTSNRLYVSDKLKVRSCMTELFDNELVPLDIASDPSKAVKTINQWVENETKHQIKDLIPALSPEAKIVLVNAAYFKGLWQSKFLPENTHKEVFHISHSKQALVEMMKQKGNFNYLISDRLGAHILELPYKGEDISMFLLLPPFLKANGVDSILKRLNNESLQELLDQDSMSPQSVEVEVPKFSIETSIDITPILSKMGVSDAFSASADFSGFTGHPEVFFDSAIHKAKIEVDEDGTTAAAATSLFLFRAARPLNPAKFVCNHPFVYLLFDRLSQTILFAGIYRSPYN